MEDSGGRHDQRERSRSSRHIDDGDRSKSPRHSRRSPELNPSRAGHSHPEPHHQQQRPRDRSRDRHRSHPSDKSRPTPRADDLIPRFRDKQARAAEQEPRTSHRSRSRNRSRDRDRGRPSRSPSSVKRHRSRSRSPHRKRSRRDHSPRESRDRNAHSSSKRRRHSPDDKKSGSSRRQGDSHRSPERSEGNRHARRGSMTNSPPHSARGSRRGSRDSRTQHNTDRALRSRSRSPRSDGRNSFSRRQSSAPSDALQGDTSRGTSASRERDQSSRRPQASDSNARDYPSRNRPDDKMTPRHLQGGSHSSSARNKDRNGGSKSPLRRNSPSPSRRNHRRESSFDHNRQDSRHGPSGSSSHAPRSPPFDPPSGPSNKGSRPGFRGDAFGGRGHRGSSSWGQGNSNNSRGQSSYDRQSGKDDGSTAMDIDGPDDRHERNERPRQDPAKGPQGETNSPSKFSFAFKPSSKTPAGPKPEISQKFNAPAQKQDTPQKDGRNDPPLGAPTQPAALFDRKPPDGPRMAPRMRKVMKKMQRPKPRPTLSPDLVLSESVFFRKPGNESVVGSGTYGKVFKGLNVYTKGQVALKRIRMEGERDGFPVTAVREIKLLQSLRHQNIVNLQEVMVEKNDCFMVFEYLSHDLTGLLNHPNFKLEPPQKKHLAQQLFEGLDYLHVRGVLHRDIKAANILVSSDGILKIADFGLARFYAKRHQLEYTNRVITIWYRSPELLLGETKYTAAVDIWSAACVMMEIFARKPIFAGDGTELSQLDKIYNVLGTPNRHDWPGLVDMAWFELLRPTSKRKSVFAETYKEELTPAAFELMQSMFLYDPAKRPTAGEVLAHPYFTTEEPLPQQAKELADIGGDWHEFESKALRKENERREREARRASRNPAPSGGPPAVQHNPAGGKDRKRGTDGEDGARDPKRVHVDESKPVV